MAEALSARRRRPLITAAVLALGGAVYLSAGLRAGGPASRAEGISPQRPAALAVAKNGDLLVIDAGRDRILERLPGGRFRIFAGTGQRGFSGDGAPAADAELNQPSAMAVARDGSVYVADTGNDRVRRISPTGTITTTARKVPLPSALAFGPDGRLDIVAGGFVLRLGTGGTLTRIAGVPGPHAGISGLGRPATDASIDGADGLAFDAAGDLYLAGFSTKTLLMIDPQGIMRAPLGTTTGFYPRGSGGLATAPDGRVLAIDTQDIVELTPHGETAVYGFGHHRIAGITGFLPGGIAVAGQRIYTDTGFGNGWSTGSAILALDVAQHRVRVLWSRRGA